MKIVCTVVELGIILATRGMYDADVGSSGRGDGAIVLVEVIEYDKGGMWGETS